MYFLKTHSVQIHGQSELDRASLWKMLVFKGCRMGRSDKVSLWYVSLLINLDFAFFILEYAIVKRI